VLRAAVQVMRMENNTLMSYHNINLTYAADQQTKFIVALIPYLDTLWVLLQNKQQKAVLNHAVTNGYASLCESQAV
jgi:hypothetical protein